MAKCSIMQPCQGTGCCMYAGHSRVTGWKPHKNRAGSHETKKIKINNSTIFQISNCSLKWWGRAHSQLKKIINFLKNLLIQMLITSENIITATCKVCLFRHLHIRAQPTQSANLSLQCHQLLSGNPTNCYPPHSSKATRVTQSRQMFDHFWHNSCLSFLPLCCA